MIGYDRPYIIYVLRDPRNNAIKYVGATCQSLPKRLQNHMNEQAIKKRLWIDELKLQGLRPVIEPIETVSSGERIAELEMAWIELFHAIGCKLLNHGYWTHFLDGSMIWHYKR
jgi:Uri superfamily endonuclease